jgi:hypothetical protein
MQPVTVCTVAALSIVQCPDQMPSRWEGAHGAELHSDHSSQESRLGIHPPDSTFWAPLLHGGHLISSHLSHTPKQHQQNFSFRLENAVQSALLEHLEAKSLKREQQSQSFHSVKPSPREHVIQNMCVSEQS